MSCCGDFLTRFASFFIYGCFNNTFLYNVKTNVVRGVKQWRKRITNNEERRNYIETEWQKVLIVIIWVCINIGLFIEACYRWYKRVDGVIKTKRETDPTAWPHYHAVYVMIARGFGQLLNFNCALILLPVMRTMLNIARTFKLGVIVPLDKNIVAHRFLAYFIVVCTIGHALAHYMNYSCCHELYATIKGNPEPSSYKAAWRNKYGMTGNILTVIMIIMYSAASIKYRRSNNFTIFWYVHHLFLLFFCGLLIHAKNFYMWFLGPAALYITERLLRNIRGSSVTIVKRVSALSSNVVHLELDKPAFRYKSGQYCFVNCPLISGHEWHPFTISSAPEEDCLTFHIRCVGDWTGALKDLFVPTGRGTVVINKPTTPAGDSYLIRVDGPFGTAAEYVFDFEYVMLVAAGIGVTPYASLLKHMMYKLRQGKKLKIKRVYFFWINRDTGSWEWFSDILDQLEDERPDFFEIHTHMTGALKADDVRRIFDTSNEFAQSGNQAHLTTEKIIARANYDYKPEATDELALNRGDEIEVQERDESGWWFGTNKTTKQSGLFPSNYVNYVDSVTKMRQGTNRRFGRPNWSEEFGAVRTFIEKTTPDLASRKTRPSVGIFVCGPPVLSKQLYSFAVSESKQSTVRFKFHKENF